MLPNYGVTHAFELIGGMITVLVDALHDNPDLTVLSMHHEQGAGFAAEGFARQSGQPAVALATSGPGATNLLTAIGSCYFDSVPVVFLTGQVNTTEMRPEGGGRQGGFQQTDIVSIAAPITKFARCVTHASEFPQLLAEAFATAVRGRPGPVLLDIPMDVQRQMVDAEPIVEAPDGDRVDPGPFLESLWSAMDTSQRPLAVIGGGVRTAEATQAAEALLTRWRLPAVLSLMGVDALPESSPWRLGFYGSYGNRWANAAVAESDLLLVLGSRLDVRQTGSDIEGFRGTRTIFHVDIDPTELNNHVPGCTVLACDLRQFLAAAQRVPPTANARQDWLDHLQSLKRRWPADAENVPDRGVNPNRAIADISKAWTQVASYVTDVGQHQMWAAQSVRLTPGQRFLTSGGMGSMGFGLPAAIGAALATSGRPVVLIAGDGGFQCNIQELQTLARLRLPVHVFVFDNGAHGMVRQFQQSYFDSRYHGTVWGYSAPDFEAVARAYGLDAHTVQTPAELARVIEDGPCPHGPTVTRVVIDPGLNAYPKMAFGRPFGSMEPDVSPLEMEGT